MQKCITRSVLCNISVIHNITCEFSRCLPSLGSRRGHRSVVDQRSDRKRLTHTPRAPARHSPLHTYLRNVLPTDRPEQTLASTLRPTASELRARSTYNGQLPIPHYTIVCHIKTSDHLHIPPLWRRKFFDLRAVG